MSTPANGFVVPDWPVTATESVEKSALLASDGSVAPAAPVLLPASATPAKAESRARFCAPPLLSRRTVLAGPRLRAGCPAFAAVSWAVSGGTREASVKAKSACWFTGTAAVGLISATLVSGAKAARSVLST